MYICFCGLFDHRWRHRSQIDLPSPILGHSTVGIYICIYICTNMYICICIYVIGVKLFQINVPLPILGQSTIGILYVYIYIYVCVYVCMFMYEYVIGVKYYTKVCMYVSIYIWIWFKSSELNCFKSICLLKYWVIMQ
jgi:hypothetical protein